VKKHCTAILIALCAAASLAAQTDTSALTDVLLNVNTYSSLFLSRITGLINGKYVRVANDDDCKKIGSLGGNETFIDTPLEIALLSACAGVVDVRPVEASTMLGNPRQADLKLGAAVYQEMQMLRFLGNTDAVGRHEGILTFITDRGNVSRAEIEKYLKDGIAEVVNAEFNSVSGFMIDGNYNAVLTRNPQNEQYELSYEGVGHITKKITAASLPALSSAMSSSGDFSATAFNTVRDNAALIPTVSQAGKTGNVEPRVLVTESLTAFFTARTPQEMTEALKIIEGICVIRLYPLKYSGQQEKDKAIAAEDAIYAALGKLNPELSGIVHREANGLISAFQSNKSALENILNRAENSLR
jgi:hypothetical protein